MSMTPFHERHETALVDLCYNANIQSGVQAKYMYISRPASVLSATFTGP